ncbi:MAG: oligosaccharide flippase family protein [Pseudomonadota bacterium]
MSFLRHTFQSANASLITAVSRFIAMAMFARTLGVESFGLLSISIFCIDLVALFALAGLPGTTTRFSSLASYAERVTLARLLSRWLLVSSIVAFCIAPIIAVSVIELDETGVTLFVVWSLLTVILTAGTARLQGAMRFDLVSLASGIAAVTIVLGAFFWVEPGRPLTAFSVLAVTVLLQILPAASLWFGITKPAPPRATGSGLPATRDMFAYGANVWLISLTTAIVWGRGEILVVEALLGAADIGIYGAAITLMAMVWRSTQMLQGAVAPHLARRLSGPGGDLESFVFSITRLTLAVSTSAALVLACCGQELAVLVFGDAFARTGDILVIIAPGAAVAGIGTVNLTTQYMSNGQFTRNMVIVAAFALLGVACILILSFGALGAGLARVVVLLAVAVTVSLWLIRAGYATLSIRIVVELLGSVLLVASASLVVLVFDPNLWVKASLCFAMAYLVVGRATGSFVPWRMIRGGVRVLRML